MPKLRLLLRNGWSPSWWWESGLPKGSNLVPNSILNSYANIYYWLSGIRSFRVVDEDWDNLIIMDACRYDEFQKVANIEEDIEKRYSPGSQTRSFLKENFGQEEWHDIVYISANPVSKIILEDSQFHDVLHVWKSHWDEDLRTVHPSDVVNVVYEASSEYPEKRFVVHFIQPHAPFIGPWAREHIGIKLGVEHARQNAEYGDNYTSLSSPFGRAQNGDIDRDTLRRGYIENLEIVMDHTFELVRQLVGKTVVTADHGDLFGETAIPFPWCEYEHPRLKAKKLLEVPWVVFDSDDRKTITSEPPKTRLKDDGVQDIDKKLSALGYRI